MAANYTSQGTYSTVQVTGPSTVQDVQVVQATAQPSGVYFEYVVPQSVYNREGDKGVVSPVADGVNWLSEQGGVAALTFSQDLDNNGLIAYFMNATVSVPAPADRSGPFTTVVQIPIGLLVLDEAEREAIIGPMLAAALKSLNSTVSA